MPSSIQNRFNLRKSEYAILAAVLCLVLAVIWGMAYRDIQGLKQSAYQAGLATVERDTNQLVYGWEAKLAFIDSLHVRGRQITRSVLAGDPTAHAQIEALKSTLHLAGPDFDLVAGFDASGHVLWSTTEQFDPTVNVADREYFQAIVQQGKDKYVGNPVFGRLANTWTIPFAEAGRGKDGSLQFVIGVAVRADLIKSTSRYFDPGVPVLVTLLRRDSEVLAREPPSGIGDQNEARRRLIETALKTGFLSGVSTSTFDGVTRLYAMRPVPGSDLLVATSMDKSAAMALTREREDETIWWSGLLSLVSIVLLISWAAWYRYGRISRLQKEILQRALDHEALLTRFAAKSTDMIALFDQNMHYIFVNQAFERILGFGAKDLLGRKPGSAVVRKQVGLLESELALLIEEKQARRFLSQVENTKGQLIWLDTEFVAIDEESDEGPRAPSYMMIGRDVSQQMADRAELLRTQEHVRTLLQMGGGTLGSTVVDLQGRKLEVAISPLSPNYEQALAAAAAGAEISIKGHVLAKDLPRVEAAYRRCIAEGHAVVEVSALDESGRLRRRRAQLVLAERRETSCEVVVYASDISQEYATRRRMELAERLATLGEVTTHLAHELNQPVASILMSAENGLRKLERDPANTADAVTRLERIRTMAVRLGEIIANVRRFGRAEDGPRQPFELSVLVQEIEILAAARLSAAQTRLAVEISHELPALKVPRLGLTQVLINLIANACDAYEANPAVPIDQRVITITAEAIGPEMMQVSITDAAGGIPADLLERIFEDFFTTKAPEKGTGVGLSISRAVMREMGGDVTAENIPGGAAFRVVVPLVAQKAELAEAASG